MIIGLLVYTAGTALCLCPILWLFDFDESAKIAWGTFKIAGMLVLIWPFISAFLL